MAAALSYGTLPSGDFNTIKNDGTYALSGSQDYENSPIANIAGIMIVHSFGYNTLQIVVDIRDNYSIYIRSTQSSGQIWKSWVKVSTTF